MLCKKCGASLRDGARFCKGCGTPAPIQQLPIQKLPIQQLPIQQSTVQPQFAYGPPMRQPQRTGAALMQKSSADPSRGPIIFLWESLKGAGKGIAALVKHPYVLLPTIVIIALQTALSFIKINAPMNLLVTVLGLLTFAQGGMYGGVIGAVGGIIGHGIFVWAVSSLIMALFSRGKKQTPAPKGSYHGSVPLIILGAGLGLVAYNFLTGDASIENALIGVTCAIACFRTARKKQGFMPGLISSFTGGKLQSNAASHIILGLAGGMVAGTLTSIAFSGYWCYIAGAVVFVAGVIFTLLGKNASRVATACFALGIMIAPLMFMIMPVQAAGAKVSFPQTVNVEFQGATYEAFGRHDLATMTEEDKARNLAGCAVPSSIAGGGASLLNFHIHSAKNFTMTFVRAIDEEHAVYRTTVPSFSFSGSFTDTWGWNGTGWWGDQKKVTETSSQVAGFSTEDVYRFTWHEDGTYDMTPSNDDSLKTTGSTFTGSANMKSTTWHVHGGANDVIATEDGKNETAYSNARILVTKYADGDGIFSVVAEYTYTGSINRGWAGIESDAGKWFTDTRDWKGTEEGWTNITEVRGDDIKITAQGSVSYNVPGNSDNGDDEAGDGGSSDSGDDEAEDGVSSDSGDDEAEGGGNSKNGDNEAEGGGNSKKHKKAAGTAAVAAGSAIATVIGAGAGLSGGNGDGDGGKSGGGDEGKKKRRPGEAVDKPAPGDGRMPSPSGRDPIGKDLSPEYKNQPLRDVTATGAKLSDATRADYKNTGDGKETLSAGAKLSDNIQLSGKYNFSQKGKGSWEFDTGYKDKKSSFTAGISGSDGTVTKKTLDGSVKAGSFKFSTKYTEELKQKPKNQTVLDKKLNAGVDVSLNKKVSAKTSGTLSNGVFTDHKSSVEVKGKNYTTSFNYTQNNQTGARTTELANQNKRGNKEFGASVYESVNSKGVKDRGVKFNYNLRF